MAVTASQYNLPQPGKRLTYAANRQGTADLFDDPSVRMKIEADLALIDHFDEQLRKLELYLSRSAKVHDPNTYYLLQSIPGVGKILALVLLYELHNIRRTVQQLLGHKNVETTMIYTHVTSVGAAGVKSPLDRS